MRKYPKEISTNRNLVSHDEYQECNFRQSDNDCDFNGDPTSCNKGASKYSSTLLPNCLQPLVYFTGFFMPVCEVVCGVS